VPAKTRPNMASPWAALSSSWRQRRPLEGQGGKGAQEKNTRAQEEQKRKCSRTGGGEKGSPSAREKRRKDLACAARLCSLHRLAAPRLPLAPACVRSPLFLCSAPTFLCSAPSPAAVHSSLLPAVRDSRLVEIQIPAFQVLLCASMLNGSC
jgi:hypothetical protein